MEFMKIRNADELLNHGDVESRRLVLEVTDEVLLRLDCHDRLHSMMNRSGNVLTVGSRCVDLNQYKRIYAFSSGKAGNHMARAFEDILGEYLTKGVAIVKIREDTDVFQRTELFVGGHPLPDERGVEGCKRMLEIADQMDECDLLLVGLSGGCSALMGYPVEGITLEELREATDVMLKSAMRVMEINDVRSHLCRMSRGRLGQHIKGSTILCFEIWDAVGLDDIEDYSMPVPIMGTVVGSDIVTFDDVRRILDQYSLHQKLPKNVVKYIVNAGPELDTPREAGNVEYYIVNTLPDSCKIAMEVAAERGIAAVVMTTYAQGESKDFGAMMASVAREMMKNGRPFPRPCMIFSAGETTTFIEDNSTIKGHGGPSQELVTGFALDAEDLQGVCMLSIDTEGTDGTTTVAGGLTDSTTCAAAQRMGVNLRRSLSDHASYEALSMLGDCVTTGNTGTNLCDFNVMYVPERRDAME